MRRRMQSQQKESLKASIQGTYRIALGARTRRAIVSVVAALGLLAHVGIGQVDAATKKKPTKPTLTPVLLNPGTFITVTVKIKSGKRVKPYTVACFDGKPGTIDAASTFTPYSQIIALAKYKYDRTRSSKAQEDWTLKQRIARAAKCNKQPAPGGGTPGSPLPPGATPTPDPAQPIPDHLSLDAYTGPFGREQAQTLFERFAWGASPERIDRAVADGLAKTVDDLLTVKDDSAADAVFDDYACDGVQAIDPATGKPNSNNKSCSPINPNDFSFDGLRYGTYHKVIYGANPYHMRIYFFLMDKWMAGVTRNANGCYQHAIRDHHDMLMRGALSGDFMQFTREYQSDLMGALVALNLRTSTKFSPNEDWAREIMERGTIGKANIDGVPNYTDADVAEMARVYTGWKVVTQRIEGSDVCFAAWVPDLHDATPKRVFVGTKYERTIIEPEDALKALFDRPETAERMALQIWTDFVNPNPTTDALRRSAAFIRADGYNIHKFMRRLMLSKAVFAPASRKSLIKHPAELVFGFLRQTGIPYDYQSVHSTLSKLGQTFLNPPTVFGWNVKDLSDEFHVLSWENGINGPIFQDLTSLEKKYGFKWHERLFANIPQTGVQSLEVTKAFANRLGLSLNDTRLNLAAKFLDFDVAQCYSNMNPPCPNTPKPGYYEIRRALDTYPSADSRNVYVTQALLAALGTSIEYRLK